eukprot:gene794-9044_t
MSDKNIITKIQNNLEGGHFYEAQQLYKTLYHKFTKSKNFEKATQILINGFDKFIEKQQYKLANDLAVDLLEVFEKAEYKTTTQVIPKKEKSTPVDLLQEMISKYPSKGDYSYLKLDFLNLCIKWSTKILPQKSNDIQKGVPSFHYILAQEYFKKNDYINAHKHFSRANSPEAHASMIFDWSLTGESSEKELFITRALLQLLCVSTAKESKIFFEEYLKLHSEVDDSFNSKTPLFNFCKFLIMSVEKNNFELFEMLKEKYEFQLQRDSSFEKYLKGIASEHFGVTQSEGGFASLLSGLFQK